MKEGYSFNLTGETFKTLQKWASDSSNRSYLLVALDFDEEFTCGHTLGSDADFVLAKEMLFSPKIRDAVYRAVQLYEGYVKKRAEEL